ncbi:mitochondrial carrier domain-containing protein [Zychaea mexicana]|uniref:mitochondrial carrier domain-containing protein n=1 Tax=Zychaea mexicana TaxID=64656 RepID=UPI0022FEC23A|nr:mitochondrial carrier domain-containing protein [Zychaea mexicana]KAI9474878.1 mitochondrial carrier domain-containing protein [Zychaea mexicana]
MPSYITDSRLNGYEAAFCGAMAGVVSRFFTAPFDVVKIRMQLQPHRTQFHLKQASPSSHVKYDRVLPALKTILREEGVRGLYKGNLAAEYLYLLYNAVEFCAYREIELAIEKLDSKKQLPGSAKTFLGGMLAGCVATSITYPLDLLRTRFAMQGTHNQQYTGIVQAVKLIYRTEGVAGFYWGVWPAVIQIMPYMGLVFASYDHIASAFKAARENGTLSADYKPIHDMLSGALSGVLSKTAVYPMDVVRKRLQVQGPSRKHYVIDSIPEYATRSWFKCMTSIAEQEGVSSLYKGLTVSLVKVAPAISLTFFVYEKTKDTLLSWKE